MYSSYVYIVHWVCLSRKRLQRHQNTETQFGETEQAPEADMAGMLRLSDRTFETTVINTQRAVMDKVDSIQNACAMCAQRRKF